MQGGGVFMKHFALIIALTFSVLAAPSLAQDVPQITASVAAGDSFVKKRYSIKGGWDIAKQGDDTVIRFDEDFRTKSGPDLKVYLSKTDVANLDGKAVTKDALKIAVLKSNRGQQSYIVPAGVNLSDYKSVVIHCEAFEVLWGGFDIAATRSAP